MTKTMNHTACTHPATKAGRAACRKARAKHEAEVATLRQAIIDSYYGAGEAEGEEVIYALQAIDPDLDYDLDIEEIVARAANL